MKTGIKAVDDLFHRKSKPVAVLASDLPTFMDRFKDQVGVFQFSSLRGTFKDGRDFMVILDGPEAHERIIGCEFSGVLRAGTVTARLARMAESRVR